MKKRVGAILTAIALMLSLLTTAAMAAGTTLTVKTPETVPRAGETFTVTVEISGNPGFASVGLAISYDETVARCESVETGDALKGAMTAVNPKASDGARVSAASAYDLDADGTLAELRFLMLKDGDPAVTVARVKLNSADGDRITCSVEGVPVREEPQTPPTSTTSDGSSEPSTPTKPEPAAPQNSAGTKTETPVTTGFPDVSPTFWGAEWIAKAVERGLFKGSSDGRFYPDAPITRADYVLVLWRMAGEPEPRSAAPFADVPAGIYYAKAVAWASEKGYVNGKGSGFAPMDSLTRQEAMKILFGVSGGQSGMELLLTGVYNSSFADSGEIAPWAKNAMYWAYYKTIISGTSQNTLSPNGTATRAQLAKILVGYQDIINNE